MTQFSWIEEVFVIKTQCMCIISYHFCQKILWFFFCLLKSLSFILIFIEFHGFNWILLHSNRIVLYSTLYCIFGLKVENLNHRNGVWEDFEDWRREKRNEREWNKESVWMDERMEQNREKIKNWIFLFMGLLKVCNILD